jgi:hypothetical protein
VGKDIETQEDFNKKILEELNFLKRAMPWFSAISHFWPLINSGSYKSLDYLIIEWS